MNTEELTRLVLTMEPQADSIGNVGTRLLETLRQAQGRRDSDLENLVAFFVEEVSRALLNGMATGAMDTVRSLLRTVRNLLLKQPEETTQDLERLPLDRQLAASLKGLSQLGGVFLRTDNLAKYLGQLSGVRRSAWRRALLHIYELNRPVRASELCEAGIFDRNHSAKHALDQMVEIDLLERRQEGANGVAFDLTWIGQSVCRALLANTQQDAEPVKAAEPVVKPVEPQRAVTIQPEEAGQPVPAYAAQRRPLRQPAPRPLSLKPSSDMTPVRSRSLQAPSKPRRLVRNAFTAVYWGVIESTQWSSKEMVRDTDMEDRNHLVASLAALRLKGAQR